MIFLRVYPMLSIHPHPVMPQLRANVQDARWRITRKERVDTMTISKAQKAEIVKEYGKDETDTGSTKVQIALLTARIKDLTGHMQRNPKDHHTRRGLLMLVGRRRRLLVYLKKQDINEYRELIAKLGIRDNI